jgi:hypothetical protein
VRAGEEDLALVGEVPEERPLAQPGALFGPELAEAAGGEFVD